MVGWWRVYVGRATRLPCGDSAARARHAPSHLPTSIDSERCAPARGWPQLQLPRA